MFKRKNPKSLPTPLSILVSRWRILVQEKKTLIQRLRDTTSVVSLVVITEKEKKLFPW